VDKKFLTWTKGKAFNLVFWSSPFIAKNESGYFDIDKTSNDYPYRLLINGRYIGDFRLLNDAKSQAETEYRLMDK
jgi:hypothetical protein